MLFLTILSFAALFVINYRIHRNLLYPPTVFTSTWLISLVGVFLSGDSLFQTTGLGYLVYLAGAVSFSAGGALGFSVTNNRTVHRQDIPIRRSSRWPYRALIICLVIILIGLPFYWKMVSSAVDDIATELMLQDLRRQAVEASNETSSLGILSNFVVLAQFLAMAMFYELDGSRSRRWLTFFAVILAVVYGGMQGAKGNAIALFLTLFFIWSIKTKELRIGALVGVLALGIAVFVAGLLLVNFSDGLSSGSGNTISSVLEAVHSYWLGGVVAFDQIAQNPGIMESTQPIYRFFGETARSLGMDVYVPPKHAEYLSISSTMDTNTYTIYFSYFKDLGWIGTVIIMVGLGLILTTCYRKAMESGVIWAVFYAKMCVALVLSIHSEHFFMGLNGYIKMLMFFLFIYKILPLFERVSVSPRVSNA